MTTRTVGVEEEFVLADAETSTPVPIGPELVDASHDTALRTEFKQEQLEHATSPCATMDDLAADLTRVRGLAVDLAGARGAVVVATGTWPGAHDPTPGDTDRYRHINEEFGHLAVDQLTCGTHVHVSVESPDEGIVALDGIRAWLPILTALCANSPFWKGEDTGHASYRTVVISRLPTAGPMPVWGDVETYRRTVDEVLETGAAFDDGMLYYDARLSASYPTVEIRVTDVCPDPDVSVAVAALCRALVTTAVDRGPVGPGAPTSTALRASGWRAARHGLEDCLIDPATGRLVRAREAVSSLLGFTREALEATGDFERVRDTTARLLTDGTYAARSRSRGAPGDVAAAVKELRIG
ncbi:carboxylate-amine ligase [Knoellia remsis]|uniref:Putative glutamate--cysteine ligase 2 n=1 Tax=Knoellia remsis TaxID=407159 RepID=A0A2T0U4V7_9MICO|nr:glutamate--cysteine ligase [Knoellia remsis]PRY52957.1 carboxylate-amine ligase [Knoellia remsis]